MLSSKQKELFKYTVCAACFALSILVLIIPATAADTAEVTELSFDMFDMPITNMGNFRDGYLCSDEWIFAPQSSRCDGMPKTRLFNWRSREIVEMGSGVHNNWTTCSENGDLFWIVLEEGSSILHMQNGIAGERNSWPVKNAINWSISPNAEYLGAFGWIGGSLDASAANEYHYTLYSMPAEAAASPVSLYAEEVSVPAGRYRFYDSCPSLSNNGLMISRRGIVDPSGTKLHAFDDSMEGTFIDAVIDKEGGFAAYHLRELSMNKTAVVKLIDIEHNLKETEITLPQSRRLEWRSMDFSPKNSTLAIAGNHEAYFLDNEGQIIHEHDLADNPCIGVRYSKSRDRILIYGMVMFQVLDEDFEVVWESEIEKFSPSYLIDGELNTVITIGESAIYVYKNPSFNSQSLQ